MPDVDEVAPEDSTGSSKRTAIFLLGRKTFEIFAARSTYRDDTGSVGGMASETSWLSSVLLRNIALPVVLAHGKRVFANGSAPRNNKPARSRTPKAIEKAVT